MQVGGAAVAVGGGGRQVRGIGVNAVIGLATPGPQKCLNCPSTLHPVVCGEINGETGLARGAGLERVQ